MQTGEINFESIFNSLPGSFLVLSAELKLVAISDELEVATNTRREEIIGRYVFDVLPDDPRNPSGFQVWKASLEKVLQTGKADEMPVVKYSVQKADSSRGEFTEKFWKPANSPVLGPSGEVQFIIHRTQEVTEIQRTLEEKSEAQQRSKDAEARMRFALSAAQMGDWELDLITGKAHRSLRHDQCFGYNELQATWTLEDAIKHIHPDDRERVKQAHIDVAAGKGDMDFEARVIWPNGALHWIAARARMEYDQTAKPIRMAGLVWDITESKRISESIKQSETRFRTLANSIPQLAWMANPDGSIFWYNDQWYKYTGAEPSEMEGWGWQKVHDPIVLPSVLKKWEESIETGKPFEMTFPLRGIDGRFRLFLTRIIPVRDSEGKVIRWFGTNTDIDEETKAQREVVNILESMSDAFIAVDKDWKITRLNARHEKLTKVKREDQLGKNLLDLFFSDPKFQESVYVKSYRKAMIDRCFVTFEDHYAPLNLWTEVRVHPQSDGGLAIFFTEISERKQNEEKLSIERKKLESIFYGSDVAMVIFRGPNLIFEMANQKYLELIGFRDIIGKPLAEALPEIAESEFPRKIKQVYDTGESFQFLEGHTPILNSKTGQLENRNFDTTFARIEDGAGKEFLIVGNAMDVTERVRSRMALEEAKKEAERANELKSSFLANMSHEIRTPLGAILGFTDLLKDKNLRLEDRDRFLETISRNGKALTKIIDDILDLAKVESGKLEVEQTEFSFFNLIDDVMDVFRERTRAKGIYLRAHLNKETPGRIVCDPTRLRQILINIVGNAVKFTNEGGVTIEVIGLKQDSNKVNFRVFVRDTGVGMDVEQMQRIFQPFMQADNTTSRKFGGTGLGLALSRRLANALNGDVSIEKCDPKEGSTFLISFEATLPSPVRESKATEPVKIQSSAILDGVRVLVADDSQDNLFLVELILTSHGAVVEVADNGAEAFRMGMRGSYDIILMDIQMPGMDGYEATRALREAGFKKPIIALTAHAMAEERARSFAAGCDGHLTKPLDKTELVATIERNSRALESANSTQTRN